MQEWAFIILVLCALGAFVAGSAVDGAKIIETSPPIATKLQLLPDRKHCGQEQIHKKNNTNVDKYPWLALLTYHKDVSGPFCTGTLINNRYVLIYGSCISPIDLEGLYVTLGHYNNNKQKFCAEAPDAKPCRDPIQKFAVEKLILHPGYSILKKEDNIGLVRLNESVVFTDVMRPVCLPFPSFTYPEFGSVVDIVSWELHKDEGSESNIKRKVSDRLITNQECGQVFSGNIPTLSEDDRFLCTVPLSNHGYSVCDFPYSGSPLLFLYEHRWQQEGIMVFGRPCGTKDPHAFIKIRPYLDWILETIQP